MNYVQHIFTGGAKIFSVGAFPHCAPFGNGPGLNSQV